MSPRQSRTPTSCEAPSKGAARSCGSALPRVEPCAAAQCDLPAGLSSLAGGKASQCMPRAVRVCTVRGCSSRDQHRSRTRHRSRRYTHGPSRRPSRGPSRAAWEALCAQRHHSSPPPSPSPLTSLASVVGWPLVKTVKTALSRLLSQPLLPAPLSSTGRSPPSPVERWAFGATTGRGSVRPASQRETRRERAMRY